MVWDLSGRGGRATQGGTPAAFIAADEDMGAAAGNGGGGKPWARRNDRVRSCSASLSTSQSPNTGELSRLKVRALCDISAKSVSTSSTLQYPPEPPLLPLHPFLSLAMISLKEIGRGTIR